MHKNDEKIVLTVAIPVLNGVKYIEECVKSVIRQNIKNLEVLVIDAGSTDGTVEILKKYADEDKRIRVVQSANKSYGAQVNIAIDKARGNFLAILESDDVLPQMAYKTLLDEAEKSGADIVKGNYCKMITDREGKDILCPTDIFETSPELYGKEINARIKTNILRLDRYLWPAVYNMRFLRENQIRLNETSGAAFQDQGFLFQTLILAEKIIYLRDIVYHYRKDNELSSVYNPNGLKYIADEYEKIRIFIEDLPQDERRIYMPLFYLTMMDTIRTRCLLRGLAKEKNVLDDEIFIRLKNLLIEGKYTGLIGRDNRFQKDLYEINLFIDSPTKYMEYTHDEIIAEKEDVEYFLDEIGKFKHVIVWGYGKTGSTLKMLLAKKNINIDIIWTDGNADIVAKNSELMDAETMATQHGNNSLYIICAQDYRYEIREKLHKVYGVDYKNIIFYTLGTSPNLLVM